MPLELYIHLPFCLKKCRYCDFLSFPLEKKTISLYMAALLDEIRQMANHINAYEFVNHSVQSIFLGGGTPSLLEPDQIRMLLDCLRGHFYIEESAEISMEANPGTLTREKLIAAYEAGINRLSIGLQSTDDLMLRRLGRIHSFKQFLNNYEMAREVGFDNINIDLMSGLPGQTLTDWKETLSTVVSLRPDHISAYSLIIEEGTPFAEDSLILSNLPDEETDRQMYEITGEFLAAQGYRRYEISNYALPGKECRHNMGYWEGTPYLGFGLGASSYYHHARFSNESDISKYIKDPFVPFHLRADYEEQTKKQEMEDRMIFGLRMMKGVSREEFKREFGVEMDEMFGSVIDKYILYGLMEDNEGRVCLTDSGIDVSNRIFEEFLL
ncbi:MAG: oxygen-independent coproporphyrinogen III oxidase [Eubacterium sp.]|nr:oxygen-independent coproporphyrinogen III oxidase [Eubacterium sp.]